MMASCKRQILRSLSTRTTERGKLSGQIMHRAVIRGESQWSGEINQGGR